MQIGVRLGPIGSRWGPIGSDVVRLGPMGSDWVISHTLPLPANKNYVV